LELKNDSTSFLFLNLRFSEFFNSPRESVYLSAFFMSLFFTSALLAGVNLFLPVFYQRNSSMKKEESGAGILFLMYPSSLSV